ncbi:hypothetical protein BRADI_2g22025v3 [Brachypodium distachyon]|uniref:Uncharacterized protein n=1 Tax=Brachypodium distachyon TaxID=15368 RepID=A0A2K2D9T8_BRADI|nr:hypothetical protein BRADI_2g22025v3 [Brachypodium distachyon]
MFRCCAAYVGRSPANARRGEGLKGDNAVRCNVPMVSSFPTLPTRWPTDRCRWRRRWRQDRGSWGKHAAVSSGAVVVFS